MQLKNRKAIFIGFALALFGLGGKIGHILKTGWGNQQDVMASTLLLVSLTISSIYLGYQLYFRKTES